METCKMQGDILIHDRGESDSFLASTAKPGDKCHRREQGPWAPTSCPIRASLPHPAPLDVACGRPARAEGGTSLSDGRRLRAVLFLRSFWVAGGHLWLVSLLAFLLHWAFPDIAF